MAATPKRMWRTAGFANMGNIHSNKAFSQFVVQHVSKINGFYAFRFPICMVKPCHYIRQPVRPVPDTACQMVCPYKIDAITIALINNIPCIAAMLYKKHCDVLEKILLV